MIFISGLVSDLARILMSIKTRFMQLLCTTLFIVLCINASLCQGQSPAKWLFTARPISGSEVELMLTVTLEPGWHIYSQFMRDDGPLPTMFTFDSSKDYILLGKVEEKSTPEKIFNQIFMIDLIWFSGTVVFTQKARLFTHTTNIKGKVEFMVCTNDRCLSPDMIEFSIEAKVDKPARTP